jgi:hypothetical protein
MVSAAVAGRIEGFPLLSQRLDAVLPVLQALLWVDHALGPLADAGQHAVEEAAVDLGDRLVEGLVGDLVEHVTHWQQRTSSALVGPVDERGVVEVVVAVHGPSLYRGGKPESTRGTQGCRC